MSRYATNTVPSYAVPTSAESIAHNISGAVERARQINVRLASLIDETTRIGATLLGPTPETTDKNVGLVAPTPSGAVNELIDAQYATETLLSTLATRIDRIGTA